MEPQLAALQGRKRGYATPVGAGSEAEDEDDEPADSRRRAEEVRAFSFQIFESAVEPTRKLTPSASSSDGRFRNSGVKTICKSLTCLAVPAVPGTRHDASAAKFSVGQYCRCRCRYSCCCQWCRCRCECRCECRCWHKHYWSRYWQRHWKWQWVWRWRLSKTPSESRPSADARSSGQRFVSSAPPASVASY
jgi:hypothetical protein